jgi:hypothetical protein
MGRPNPAMLEALCFCAIHSLTTVWVVGCADDGSSSACGQSSFGAGAGTACLSTTQVGDAETGAGSQGSSMADDTQGSTLTGTQSGSETSATSGMTDPSADTGSASAPSSTAPTTNDEADAGSSGEPLDCARGPFENCGGLLPEACYAEWPVCSDGLTCSGSPSGLGCTVSCDTNDDCMGAALEGEESVCKGGYCALACGPSDECPEAMYCDMNPGFYPFDIHGCNWRVDTACGANVLGTGDVLTACGEFSNWGVPDGGACPGAMVDASPCSDEQPCCDEGGDQWVCSGFSNEWVKNECVWD